ncbi:MAG: hypothetical protein AAFR27_01490 [Pseudomonadota bacterium]
MKQLALALAVTFLSTPLNAEETHQPYAGLEDRAISSLSTSDIAELRRGGGWGLALPAELNGYPGPAHVLELSEELSLSDDQIAKFEAIFEEMRTEAITIGQKLIEAERVLDEGFRNGGLLPAQLQFLIKAAERHRAELRMVHLSRHLISVDILSPTQIARYSALRGYADDPCLNAPEGHDAEMWRRHNGCQDN